MMFKLFPVCCLHKPDFIHNNISSTSGGLPQLNVPNKWVPCYSDLGNEPHCVVKYFARLAIILSKIKL